MKSTGIDSGSEITMASTSKKLQASSALDALAVQTQNEFERAFYTAILESNPDHLEVLKAHAKNLASLRLHQEGVDIDLRIARLRPNDPLAFYNLACSYALTKSIDDSLSALRRALELGYRDFRFIKEDRDLDAIRKDPRYRDMIREFQKS